MQIFAGHKVKALLALKKLKQNDLAKHLGIAEDTLSKELRGHVRMTTNRLGQIAEFLGVKIEDLCEEQGSEEGGKP